jgi:uroporphyrinogen-III synthase
MTHTPLVHPIDHGSTHNSPTPNFAAQQILALESRRSTEMQTLIENMGGIATVAPSLREVQLERNLAVLNFAQQLEAGVVDFLVCMTGVGTRMLLRQLEAVAPHCVALLDKVRLVARGTKPLNVLREAGLQAELVSKPHTWREIQHYFADLKRFPKTTLTEKNIVIGEFGECVPLELMQFLQAKGAKPQALPIYRWAFPENLKPLDSALERTARGEFSVLLLTSGVQLWHFMARAQELGLEDEVRDQLCQIKIASIGPACSEAIRELGFEPTLEADPHRMGILVMQAAEYCAKHPLEVV